MSGIVGIWNLDGQPADDNLLATLSAAIAHRGPDGESRWVEGPVGLACQLMRVTPESLAETQPLVHASGAVIVFDGRLDNREELLEALKPDVGVTRESPDPALVLTAYAVYGDQFPERLNGDFALAIFDPNRKRLLLARDALGVRPLYYRPSDNAFLFASEIKSILAHPQVSTSPNEDLLANFLAGGVQDGLGTTYFNGIFSVPPGRIVVVTDRGLSTRQYWDFNPIPRIRFGSFEEYAEAFRWYFTQAVRRRMRSAYPIAMSVSGGLDSSSILSVAATLKQQDPEGYPALRGFSYQSEDGSLSDEREYLHELEKKYQVAIELFSPGVVSYLHDCKAQVWHMEAPTITSLWGALHGLMQRARRSGARVLLVGEGGDEFLFDSAYLLDLVRRLAFFKARAHLKEFSRWNEDARPNWFMRCFIKDLIRNYVPERMMPLARKIKRGLKRRNEGRHPYYAEFLSKRVTQPSRKRIPGKSFPSLQARSLFETSIYMHRLLEWYSKLASSCGLEPAFPMLDRDLLSFLMAIPGEVQNRGGVPRGLLREGLRGILPDLIRQRRWKADYGHLLNLQMKYDYAELSSYLQQDAVTIKLGYVMKERLAEELSRLKNQFEGPTCVAAQEIAHVFGAEMWLRTFFADQTKEVVEYAVAK